MFLLILNVKVRLFETWIWILKKRVVTVLYKIIMTQI